MTEEGKNKAKEFDIATKFREGLFLILMILLFIATIHFYFSITSAVSNLFDYQYVSLVNAGFAACVIVVVVFFLRNIFLKQ